MYTYLNTLFIKINSTINILKIILEKPAYKWQNFGEKKTIILISPRNKKKTYIGIQNLHFRTQET